MSSQWSRGVVVWVAAIAGVVLIALDLLERGLGGCGNGKFVSLLDSVNTCYRFRCQRPHLWQSSDVSCRRQRRDSLYCVASVVRGQTATQRSKVQRAFLILANNILCKFGPATLVSFALGETPVLFRGPRHSLSFLGALLAVQLSDGAFDFLQREPVQAVLSVGVSLYKLRKAAFIAHVVGASSTATSLAAGALLMCLVIDGTSLARRATNVVVAGVDGSCTSPLPLRAWVQELGLLLRGCCQALWPNALLLVSLLQAAHVSAHPGLFVCAPILGAGAATAATAAVVRCQGAARALALAYFVRRNDASVKAQRALSLAAQATMRWRRLAGGDDAHANSCPRANANSCRREWELPAGPYLASAVSPSLLKRIPPVSPSSTMDALPGENLALAAERRLSR